MERPEKCKMKELLEEIKEILSEPGCEDPGIAGEPELVAGGFLQIECVEKNIGRATALRNYWSWVCSR